MTEQLIPTKRLRMIVEAWVGQFDTPTEAYRVLESATGVKADSWRKRFSDSVHEGPRGTWRGWWSYAELAVEDVDEFLVAADLVHLWQSDLADLAPTAERVSNKVRLPGESTPRIKKLSKAARLNRDQIHALHRLHIEGRVSVRELCRRGWRTWGYANEKSALNAVLDLLRSFGLQPRDRIEATQLATVTHGKLRRGQPDPEFRRQERIRRGEIRNVYCAAIKTRYGKGRGERCRRPALAGSTFCIAHDPARADERAAVLARGPRHAEESGRVMEQASLFGDVRETTLTERQAYALDQIQAADGGLASDELGAVMHERRGKHDRGVRCTWCQSEGQSVARELRKKGLVVRRRSGCWQSLRPLDSTASIGAGAVESSGPAAAPGVADSGLTTNGAQARSEDDSFGAWMEGLPT